MTQQDFRAGRDLEQLRTDIIASFEAYIAELEQAGPHWERKPAEGGEGEDAWNARQVAEHLAGSTLFFGAGLAQGIGSDGPTPKRFEFPDPAEAVGQMNSAQNELMAVVGRLQPADLDKVHDFGRMGTFALGRLVGLCDVHLQDHANQLRKLREA